jgi:hypothetical protein
MTTLDYKIENNKAVFTEVGEFYSQSEADNAQKALNFSLPLIAACFYVFLSFWSSKFDLSSAFAVLVLSGGVVFLCKSFVRVCKAKSINKKFRGLTLSKKSRKAIAVEFMQEKGMTFEQADLEVIRVFS